MALQGRLFCLYLITLYGCMCQKHEDQHPAMFLAGPMTNTQVKHLNGKPSEGTVLDTFDCSHPIPPGSKQYFEYLQSRGVTHFKVPLSWDQFLPSALSSEAQQAVVTCYQTLLKQLLEVGLQPLIVLHGSTVPDTLSSSHGGWESQEVAKIFQQYAEFAFQVFGELAHSWVTLSNLDELSDAQLQNALDAHTKIYHRYHQLFPRRDGGVSAGVKASKAPFICNTQQLKYSDFLSIKIQYDCTTGQNLAEELQNILATCGDKPILFYEVDIKD
uniref:lactase-phlorizin hydrolase-like n=1 Tax=Scatophagus argus TaxID=75038 RepID=UPI001ED8031C